MPTLTTDRIRLRVDADQKTAAQDALRGATPILWRSTDVVLEVGLYYNGEVLDVSNLAALTIEIKTPGASGTAADPEAAPLASKTVTAFDATLTTGTWADLSKQHASVGFSATEMNFALGGLAAQWLVVSLLTSAGKTITVAAGLVTVREDGYDSAGTAPVLDGSAYTKAETLALFPQPQWVRDNTQVEIGRITDSGNIIATLNDYTVPRRVFEQPVGDGTYALMVAGANSVTGISLAQVSESAVISFDSNFTSLSSINNVDFYDGAIWATDLPVLEAIGLVTCESGEPDNRLSGSFPALQIITGHLPALPSSAPTLNDLNVTVPSRDVFYNALVTLTQADDGYVNTNAYGTLTSASLTARNALAARGWTIVL